MLSHLLQNSSIREVGAPVAAGSAIDNNSDTFDISGYDSVAFICPITDSVDTGVASMIVEQGDESDGSDAAALSGATATATSGANDDLNDQLLVVEIARPDASLGRYLRVNRTSATANIAFGNVIAIGLKRSKLPESAHSTVLSEVLAISPAAA